MHLISLETSQHLHSGREQHALAPTAMLCSLNEVSLSWRFNTISIYVTANQVFISMLIRHALKWSDWQCTENNLIVKKSAFHCSNQVAKCTSSKCFMQLMEGTSTRLFQSDTITELKFSVNWLWLSNTSLERQLCMYDPNWQKDDPCSRHGNTRIQQ